MALVSGIDHFTIVTDRLDDTIEFFEQVFELENRPQDRPDFDFGGAWLFHGERALVHLMTTDSEPGKVRGAFDHVAFRTDDFDGLIERLTAAEIAHSISGRPEIGLRQVFLREPNGVRIEVTCRS